MVDTDKLIERLESEYGFRVAAHEVIKQKPGSSFVAKFVAETGEAYVLKSLFVEPERQRFIAESERLLAERGVKLARPVPTKNGDLFIEHEGAPYVLYEWAPGQIAPLKKPEDLFSIVELAARFHRASRDVSYPAGTKVYGHLDWREEYQERLRSMEEWLSKHAAAENGKRRLIADSIPFFLKAGRQALRELRKSAYSSYLEGKSGPLTLVHGDLHNENVLSFGKKNKLIDFEDVRYDAPSKDLIRIHSMYAKRRPFEASTFRTMLERYENIHPLSPEVRRIVHVDLLFPHVFERMLRKKKYKKWSEEEIAAWLTQERQKTQFVQNSYIKRSRKAGKEGTA